MLSERGDLSPPEHCFEGQFDEEFGCGGEEGGEGVGGGCEDGVDTQCRSEEKRG